MKVCLAGEGYQGGNHMKAIRSLGGIDVVSLAGGIQKDADAFAREWEIPHVSLDLEACLARPGVDAVILATPTQVHTQQIELSLAMSRHVLVEVPMGANLQEAERVARLEEESGLVCMVCHSLRYFPTHREVRRRVRAGELHLHHIVSQSYYFRRTNTNALGKPRTWVDNVLWHHACHIVDYVSWLLDDPDLAVWGQSGPVHQEFGMPMDLTIGMRSRDGCVVSAVLSFNNHGTISVNQRFIGEETTLTTDGSLLVDYQGNEIPVTGNSHQMQIGEFFDAVRQGRKPLTSFVECLRTMRLLDRIERSIEENRTT